MQAYLRGMSTLQVRDVRPETAAILKRRAEAEGVSLSEYLRGQLDRIAAVPSRTEVLERIRARSAPELGSAVSELAQGREERAGA